jgi:hypothetical protein
MAMAGDGSMLHIATEGGLWVLDGSQAAPCELAFLDTQSEGFLVSGVDVAGGLAYLPSEGGIHVVDVSDPRAPAYLGKAEADEDPVRGKEWTQALVVGSRLFSIASFAGYLGVYDLVQPAEPRLSGLVQLPAQTATNDQTGPFMAYAGGHLFVADEAGGLVAVDVADPSRLKIAGRLRLPGSVEGVVTDGDHLYVASDGGGFFVIDWSGAGSASVGPTAGVGQVSLAAFRGPLAEPSGQPHAPGSCVVTTTADSSAGSLRGCLEQAQAGDVVTFDASVFPPDLPATIHVQEELGVPGGVTVDGIGAGVILDGGGKTETAFGIYESETRISRLEVTNFTGFGIDLGGSKHTISRMVIHGNGEGGIRACCNAIPAGAGGEARDFRILGNLIGLDRTGTRLAGSQEFGIYLQGTGHSVGGPSPTDRNVIAGSRVEIELDAAQGVTIEGNYIAIDAGGRIALDDPGQSRAIVGESGAAENRVVNNVVNGVIQFLDPGSSYNLMTGNLVGVDPSGNRPLGGGQILIGEPFNQVGGGAPGAGNVVGGGILIESSDVIVLGNMIDLGRDGRRLGNGGHIDCSKDRCVIGGRSPGAANVVGGAGIKIAADESVVIGNRVRTDPDPDIGAGPGISIEGGRNSVVANLVEAGAVGISLSSGAHANVVRGNVLRGNFMGLLADASTVDNLIAGNAFRGNRRQARDAGVGNQWDDSRLGNYWSELTAVDADANGIIDRARPIGPEGVDRYPLAEPP